MGDFFFFIKMIVFTLVLVLVLQVKIGPTTLEQKVMTWTHKSEFSEVVQNVAESAIRAMGIGYSRVKGLLGSKSSATSAVFDAPGSRLKSTIDDSKDYLQKKFGQDRQEEVPSGNATD